MGTKAANELGVFDMSGNIVEWISDYADVIPYTAAPRRVRGGGWADPPIRIIISDRTHGGNADYTFFGFRIAKNK